MGRIPAAAAFYPKCTMSYGQRVEHADLSERLLRMYKRRKPSVFWLRTLRLRNLVYYSDDRPFTVTF